MNAWSLLAAHCVNFDVSTCTKFLPIKNTTCIQKNFLKIVRECKGLVKMYLNECLNTFSNHT